MIKLTKLIGIIERCSIQYRINEFKELGLCGAHHTYIFYLCKKPGMSQEQLAKDIHINKSNVARSIKLLEENGYIEVKCDQVDKRINRLYPTQKAYDALPYIREKIKAWNNTLLRGLNEEEIEALEPLLRKIAQNAIEGVDEIK